MVHTLDTPSAVALSASDRDEDPKRSFDSRGASGGDIRFRASISQGIMDEKVSQYLAQT